jgi:hypothetical protein
MTFRIRSQFDKFPMLKEKIMKTAVTFLIAAAFLMMPWGVFAQQGKTTVPASPGQAAEQPAQGTANPKMMEQHEQMKAEHDKMMKEMNARLDAKVAAMDAAKGEKKIDAMGAVIKEMVSQRKEMQEHMMKMREQMGQHWKERKGGSGEGGKGM